MLDELIADIRKEFPDFRLVPKEKSSFMRLLDLLLRIITFGQMKAFMTTFTTTIGNTIYTPSVWPMKPAKSKIIILRHERVHLRQRARLGLWYSVSYLLFPLPAVFAYCRMKYEMEAYAESLQAISDIHGMSTLKSEALKDAYVKHFTGPEYFWTWPWRGRIERWYDETAKSIQEQNK
jgi:hypothetical protein